jgi:hypothetical protein
MYKFSGSLDELQNIVSECNVRGKWKKTTKQHYYQFSGKAGKMILNWWPHTGTINFQGKRQERFEAMFLKHAPDALPQSDDGVWEDVPQVPVSGGKTKQRKTAGSGH